MLQGCVIGVTKYNVVCHICQEISMVISHMIKLTGGCPFYVGGLVTKRTSATSNHGAACLRRKSIVQSVSCRLCADLVDVWTKMCWHAYETVTFLTYVLDYFVVFEHYPCFSQYRQSTKIPLLISRYTTVLPSGTDL